MNRHILCRACGERQRTQAMHPEDKAMGWKRRFAYISGAVPTGHGFKLNGEFHPLFDIHCDGCDKPITGEIAIARTMWNTNREGEPRQWESEYGKILSDREVKLADALNRKGGKP